MWLKCDITSCFDKFVAWLIRYGGGPDSHLGLKNGIGFRYYWAWFAWIANWMGWKLHWKNDINAWTAKCAGCKVHEPTQSAQTALWVCGTPSAWTHAKCMGSGLIVRAALSARAAIVWGGEWTTLPTHLPCTCHAMSTQCKRGPTRFGPWWAVIARHVKG